MGVLVLFCTDCDFIYENDVVALCFKCGSPNFEIIEAERDWDDEYE